MKSTTPVYFRDPSAALVPNSKGRLPQQPQLLAQGAYPAKEGAEAAQTRWQPVALRPDARAMRQADVAARRVWTLRDDGRGVAETLRLRRDGQHRTDTLTKAPFGAPLQALARRKSARSFVERAIQEAKREVGWDEFQAVK